MAEVSPLPDHVLDLGRRLIGKPVFLVGCARSGTSIFGEALAAHPRVAYLFEASYLWNDLVPARPDHRLSAQDVTPEIARGLYEALADERRSLTGDVLVEKNPKHVIRIPFLTALFPEALFLHIIRDGRDAVASLMFRNRGNRWGHLQVPGWQDLLQRHPEANHVRCAYQWRDAVRLARTDANSLAREQYLEVRYEELLQTPGQVVREALAFVGLPDDPAVEAFLPKIQDSTRSSYHARKQVRHYVENHSRRVGRHEENLTAVQRKEVLAVCGDLLDELGYSPTPGA